MSAFRSVVQLPVIWRGRTRDNWKYREPSANPSASPRENESVFHKNHRGVSTVRSLQAKLQQLHLVQLGQAFSFSCASTPSARWVAMRTLHRPDVVQEPFHHQYRCFRAKIFLFCSCLCAPTLQLRLKSTTWARAKQAPLLTLCTATKLTTRFF